MRKILRLAAAVLVTAMAALAYAAAPISYATAAQADMTSVVLHVPDAN